MPRFALIRYIPSWKFANMRCMYTAFLLHILTFILFVQGTWPPYSRHRSVGHTKSGVGEAAGHRELATSDCGATASRGYDGSRHGQGISSRLPNRYRWREKEFTIARDTDETQQNLLRSSGSGIHVHSRSQYGTRVKLCRISLSRG